VASGTRQSGRLWCARNTRGPVTVVIAVVWLTLNAACAPEGPGSVPTHPTDTYTVTLEWDAPTEDAVGRPLGDLASFRLYYREIGAPSFEPEIDVGMATRASLQGIAAGEYVFAVTAVDELGNESDLSEPLVVEVGP
jgi:hypothetical protein